jgi:hypothetical protein
MANTLVRTNFDLSLDILRDITAEVTLDLQRAVDEFTNANDLFFGKIANLGCAVDVRTGADRPGGCVADAVDVLQRNVDTLVARKIDSCDSGHALLSL